jgi:hypothetical protein
MSIYKDRAIAIEDLDFLIDSIKIAMTGRARKDHKKGFDNNQVLFMIKGLDQDLHPGGSQRRHRLVHLALPARAVEPCRHSSEAV